ncbi:MAG: transposase, partial [Pirellulales bacterium]|nr:transposase [Pirellulales bacterium]
LNDMLEAMADAQCGAKRYERSPERVDTRAGHYERKRLTSSGEVTLRVPRLRNLSFETPIIERYRRRESSVEEALIEMYVAGVSVPRMEDITEALCGAIGLPLRALLYVPRKDIAKLSKNLRWEFSTKLQQSVPLASWAWSVAADAGKRLWLVSDGAYAKGAFQKPLRALGIVVVSRLRKDASLLELPPTPKPGERRWRGRPPIYGKRWICLAKRGTMGGGV